MTGTRLIYVSSSQCDMQKLTVDELKRLLYDTFRDHLTMKDIENIIMTEESHLNSPECHVDIDSKSQKLGFYIFSLPRILILGCESVCSEPNTTGKTHVCAQKPDLCLRHRIHHQRDAHRCKSDAPQGDEVRMGPPQTRGGQSNQTSPKLLDPFHYFTAHDDTFKLPWMESCHHTVVNTKRSKRVTFQGLRG